MTAFFSALRFGGDYNPEQWPREVWNEDVSLMQRAGVTTATVGVFSWARLEPRPGEYDFEWLDDVLARLDAGGIRVILATGTASPPAWLAREHPESLPVTSAGVRLGFGSRQQYSPSSQAFREHAMRLVEQMAKRYGAHPALEAWHTGNEYGCHVSHSYDDESAAAFRVWLEQRYGSIASLNDAWGTAFWSQGYGSFDEVGVPADAPTFSNPTQLLDFDRFSSDALLALHRAEREILARESPGVPVTTNFMGFFRDVDYFSWAEHVDFVSDDSYPDPADALGHVRLAASRDLMRSLKKGTPWLLMEQATSAVNWRARNAPKAAGLNRVQSLQAVARGADGVLYFQWRQSKAGAEKFHSALVPHAGPDSRIFREVTALGAELATLGHVVGEPVEARVAMIFDWNSWWALEQQAVPTELSYVDIVLAWYRPFYEAGVTIDFVPLGADVSGYSVVVAPALMVASEQHLALLDGYVQDGGTLVVGYQSAVLDENLHVYLGGYLGPLQKTLGVRVEEFAPLAAALDEPLPTTAVEGVIAGTASLWQELVRVDSAEVVSRFADGFARGEAAITRNRRADGTGWYVATQPDHSVLSELVAQLLEEADIPSGFDVWAEGVEIVRRGGVTFVLNHTAESVEVSIDGVVRSVPAYDALLIEEQG
ncbi:beta-galactosidase [Agreia sp. COWG]|uniref:beta-galactosidase n=1 Tax=Agreia sp. COWG TaxID=2773266 RepID=UPI0019288D56|nr:beta-galactosidase [Agreia sp. COWG]CAD6007349.1 Beta-galactosidase bgaB [Agreia sp. COWG]